MKTSKYFAPQEFRRCSPSCTIDQMDQRFLDTLDALRAQAGIPLVLNCAYRSVAHEKARGRSGNSAHTKGLAADIRCNSSATRWKIVTAALALGIRRIGIGKSYVHVDIDGALPQDVVWHYYD
jgi:uncharacterized protein YcbK (DUF882 family)